MAKSKILMIEDDADLASILSYNLTHAGYEVLVAHDGVEGLRMARSQSPQVILLDLMLPGIDGFEVCRQLRSDATTAFIVMLTAKTSEVDQIIGLSLGADDYVTKPFSVSVLLERIKALMRRPKEVPDDILEAHDVRVDRRAHKAWAGNEELRLTFAEFQILYLLISQPGRTYSRKELVGGALGDAALERTVDVHIRALRQKLGHHSDRIETVRGAGYKFRGD
jgi:DNA-binding response OmpR family regulator